MDGTTGGRCQASYATTTREGKDPQDDRLASYAVRDGDGASH